MRGSAPLIARGDILPARGSILIDDVVKDYGTGDTAVRAVNHCTLEIPGGEICMIVGPSGCGKTTLLNAIAGFHEITSGRILLDAAELCSTASPKAVPGADRIVVFQNGALFPWKTNLENVAFGPIVQRSMTTGEANEKARSLMADAGLSGRGRQLSRRNFVRHAPPRRDRARLDQRSQGSPAR
jgi:NitT/TauT family transport system ATP-binding protein